MNNHNTILPCDNRRLLIAVLFVLPWLGMHLTGQTLPVRIVGNSYLSVETLQQLTRTLKGDSLRIELLQAYTRDGYLDAVVEPDTGNVLRVTEGTRYRIDSVRIVPDSLKQELDVVFRESQRLTGEFFSTSALQSRLDQAVVLLNNNGYPLARARVSVLDVHQNTGTATVELEILPGEPVRIREVEIRGNTITKRSLILTAIDLKPNEPFTESLADHVRSRLKRLGVFSQIGEPELYRMNDSGYGLLIPVTEGDANSFDGLIGYQPPTVLGGSGTITGLLNFVLRNMFGTGRRLAVRWSKQTLSAQELEIQYGEPFLFGLSLDLEIGFRQHQESETAVLLSYVQRTIHGDFLYQLGDAVTVKLGVAIDQILPQADSAQPCSRQYLNSSTLESTLGLIYDTRSDPINPTSGARATVSYTLGDKSINGPVFCLDTTIPTTDTRRRTEFSLDLYVPLFRPIILTSGLHGGDVQGSLIEDADMFRFGGQSTVRGYRENLIRASRRVWGTIEPRILLSGRSFLSVFFDLGYYQRPATLTSTTAIEESIYGYGIGAQIETPLGLANLSFALGKGDTFETGKIFIGIANTF